MLKAQRPDETMQTTIRTSLHLMGTRCEAMVVEDGERCEGGSAMEGSEEKEACDGED